MNFEDELQRSLAVSQYNARQQEIAAQRTLDAALKGLDRITTKVGESAAFLASRDVPTVPFLEERMQKRWTGEKKQQRALAGGWIISAWLAISEDGLPWQVYQPRKDGKDLAKSAPWYLEGMRQQILAREPVHLPLGYTLLFPTIQWSTNSGSFYGDENEPVKVDTNHYDSVPTDAEHVLTHGVVELVRTQGR